MQLSHDDTSPLLATPLYSDDQLTNRGVASATPQTPQLQLYMAKRLSDPISYIRWSKLSKDLELDEQPELALKLKRAIRDQLTDAVEKILNVSIFDLQVAAQDDDLFSFDTATPAKISDDDLLGGLEQSRRAKILKKAPPSVVGASGTMTPPARKLYLKPDNESGANTIFETSKLLRQAITADREYPLDCVAHHKSLNLWVCFSSKIVPVPARNLKTGMLRRDEVLLQLAADRVKKYGKPMPADLTASIPGHVKYRKNLMYSRLPLYKTGVPNISDYGIRLIEDDELSLDAHLWRPWFNTLNVGILDKVTVFKSTKKHVWVLRDPYHLIAQIID